MNAKHKRLEPRESAAQRLKLKTGSLLRPIRFTAKSDSMAKKKRIIPAIKPNKSPDGEKRAGKTAKIPIVRHVRKSQIIRVLYEGRVKRTE
jgi:hypothetical protein